MRMKGHTMRKLITLLLTLVIGFNIIQPIEVNANTISQDTYKLYPHPQTIDYKNDSYIIGRNVNVIYDETIDNYTQDRLLEVIAHKDMIVSYDTKAKEGQLNIYVGTYGSGDVASTHIQDNYEIDETLFENTDAYYLNSNEGEIVILGKDTDASFYGLTTLYHVFDQMESLTIRNFEIYDYADITSRGFIEGYYGNPWSTEDRIDLMTWSGYYKLNSYFYAPKDDPKHNSKWRELYTEAEIEQLIKPLADAGNASKTRFVYALHPYMISPIRYTNETDYQNDLDVMKAKFTQVIEAGVRQISILADDAANVGADNYIRTLEDMTAWLAEMKNIYPDLKMELPFVTQEYMYHGESYFADFPENVQVVMTGGRIWGEVSQSFTDTFTNNVGRGPYLWINWPCTDNSKQHLIMGGYKDFLHPNVNPDNIEGIVLNPMQQSEPSKVAIFGNATYAWNVWESDAIADQAWNDAFSFVDGNSAYETESSQALRELSKHMINQNMDSRVRVLEESVELREVLDELKVKLSNDALTEADIALIDEIIGEFEVLQQAAFTYRESASNGRLRDQIVYWLNSWDDTNRAAISYLKGIKAYINGDISSVITYNADGETHYANSKTYGFDYVGDTEYAEVGVQHIVPLIQAMGNFLSTKAQLGMDPDMLVQNFITSRTDSGNGDVSSVFDGDDSTGLSFRSNVWIKEGEYVGVLYNQVIEVNDIRFLMGRFKNYFENSKLEFTLDGEVWQDIPLVGIENAFVGVYDQYLDIKISKNNLPNDFKAMGIRLIATEDNKLDAYLDISEIAINKVETNEVIKPVEYSTTMDHMSIRGGDFSSLSDGNPSSEAWFAKGPYDGEDRESVPVGATLTFTLDTPTRVGVVEFYQGQSASGDVLHDATLQYQLAGSDTWTEMAKIDASLSQKFDFGGIENVAKIRIYNNAKSAGWVRIGEVVISETKDESPISYNIIKSDGWGVYHGPESNLYDENDNTMVWYSTAGNIARVDDYLGYDLGKVATLQSAHIVVGEIGGDKFTHYTVETSIDGEDWVSVPGYESYYGLNEGKDTLNINLGNVEAQFIRIRNLTQVNKWVKFSGFTVKEFVPGSEKTNVYTNKEEINVFSHITEGEVSLSGDVITLQPNEYIGVLLDSVYTITEITNTTDLEVETAIHPLIWNTFEVSQDAKYVRLLNKTNEDITVDVDGFKVNYAYISDKSVSSDFANHNPNNDMRTSNNVEKVFDGDLSTAVSITGPQEQGREIILDLGQVIDLTSLRYYINESSLDYPRAVAFMVSESVDGPWTQVMHIGPEETSIDNTSNTSVAKDYVDYLTHDSTNPGNVFADSSELNHKARYIKVTPTQTYSHRWLEFGELVVNGGAYITQDATKDIISSVSETPGLIPSNAIDGDYSTSYRPSESNGSFTYRLSEKDQRNVRIIHGGAISHASVSAVIHSDTSGLETIELGTLSQVINEFALSEDQSFVSIIVKWSEIVPEIIEFKTSDIAQTTVNKAELQTLVSSLEDTSTWTQATKTSYEDSINLATALLENSYVTQEGIDGAVGAIKSAIANHVIKGDIAILNEILETVQDQTQDDVVIYTKASYLPYNAVVNRIKRAISLGDNTSQSEVEALVIAYQTAASNLDYSAMERELAELSIMQTVVLSEENYTEASYTDYVDAKTKLEDAIAADKGSNEDNITRINPLEVKALHQNYVDTIDALVVVTDLINLMEISYIEENYTADSWAIYETAYVNAEALLVNGSQTDVDAMIVELQAAIDQLVIDDVADIEAVIEEMKQINPDNYTTESYEALVAAVEKAEADLPKGSEALNVENIENMQASRNALVNVKTLKALLAHVESMDNESYTNDSYQSVLNAVEAALPNLVNGSEETVHAAVIMLEEAIHALQLDAKDLEAYLLGLENVDTDLYTESTVSAYETALNALLSLEVGNTTRLEFIEAKDNYEAAVVGLVFKSADYTALDEVLSKVPVDLGLYTDKSVSKLQVALSKVDRELNITQQDVLDLIVNDIEKALSELVLKGSLPTTGSSNVLYYVGAMSLMAGIYLVLSRRKETN